MSASLFANSSRRLIAAGVILALTACGGGGSGSSPIPGGGGGGSTPAPTAAPTATPTPGSIPAGYGKPVFHITIPRSAGSSQGVKSPSFISTATQSVSIQLTADSQGIDPASIGNNPAITDVSGASCSSGCSVDGPLSPIGSNTYTITTYDQTGAGGNALDTAVDQVFTIAQGVANNESVTLLGIPATITLPDGMPEINMIAGQAAWAYLGPAGSRVIAKDAAGQVIVGTYATPVTISDPDTNGDGSFVSENPCPSIPPTGNPTISSTTAELDNSFNNIFFCYGGIAENQVAIGATSGSVSNSATFAPALSAPVYVGGSGSPSSVVTGNPPDIALFALTGVGSTGSVTYTETGWTESPYNQTLIAAADLGCTSGGPFFLYGQLATAYDVTGTIFTLSYSTGTPAVGACPVQVTDGANVNATHTTAQFDTSYSTTGFGINSTRKSR